MSLPGRRPFLAPCVWMIGLPAALLASPARAGERLPMPDPVKGALVIAGGGALPEAIQDHFLNLAGGKAGRILVIPTASSRAEQPELLTAYQYFKSKGVAVSLLHTRDRKRADDELFARQIREASGVWLTGGDQNRLVDTYRGTCVERELHDLLGRGKVIGGTSAGAAVMSGLAILGGEQLAKVGHGFGFFPGVVIDQHFQNRQRMSRLQGVLASNPRLLGVGIDEETAVVIQGRTLSVLGHAHVHVCWRPTPSHEPSMRTLKAGDRLDFLDLYQTLLGETVPPPRAE